VTRIWLVNMLGQTWAGRLIPGMVSLPRNPISTLDLPVVHFAASFLQLGDSVYFRNRSYRRPSSVLPKLALMQTALSTVSHSNPPQIPTTRARTDVMLPNGPFQTVSGPVSPSSMVILRFITHTLSNELAFSLLKQVMWALNLRTLQRLKSQSG